MSEKFIMQPFWNISWRSKEIQQKWAPIVEKTRHINSIVEYESVKQGFRKCNTYHLYSSTYDKDIEKIMNDGLYFQPILRSKIYNGGGYVHYPSDKLGPNTFVYGVVANDKESGDLFKEYSIPGNVDHRIIGELLGYPKCCVNWFIDTWIGKNKPDPMYEVAENTKGVKKTDSYTLEVSSKPELNRFIRYSGAWLCPFHTHSLDCKDAIKFTDWWGELFKQQNEFVYDELIELLSMGLTWSVNNYIVYVEHPLFRLIANGFDSGEPHYVKLRGHE